MYDILFKKVTVVDGTGGAPYEADVAVAGDRIAEIAPELCGAASVVVAGAGLVLAPGFIDIHSHTDANIFENPFAESKLLQGVTLDVTGNCGLGFFPVAENRRGILEEYLAMHEFVFPQGGIKWSDLAGFADKLEKVGIGVNLAPLIGHGALRIAVMGMENRPPERQEMGEMKRLLEEMLAQGAWGMSTGLIYPPGSFASTEELIELAVVLARKCALYASHIRGEGTTLFAAIDEAIEIGRKSGAAIEVSHLKALGKANWGRAREALNRIAGARRQGIDIGADQYPYEATETTLSVLLPGWALAGGAQETGKRLADAKLIPKLAEAIKELIVTRGDAATIMFTGIASEKLRFLSGKTLADAAALWNLAPEAAALRILQEDISTHAAFFSLSPADVESIMKSDFVAVGSDGLALSAANAEGMTHPRSYGTFPLVLETGVRERGLLSLEKAIYKMTGLPSHRLGLTDRGIIRSGYIADLALFDPSKIAARSTFANPHQYPTGIRMVTVNGQIAARDGKLTGVLAGLVLKKHGSLN
ncbi:MAG: N-acyl-D-amino-acid deacylase family protein [Syntrophales bacterium]